MMYRKRIYETFVLEHKSGNRWIPDESSAHEENISAEYEKMLQLYPNTDWRIVRELKELVRSSDGAA